MMTFSMVLGVLALFAVGIYFIAGWVTDTPYIDEERIALQREDLDRRLAPVGQVMLAGSEQAQQEAMAASSEATVASADTAALSGEEIYQNNCASCHAAGVLEAPVMGDQEAWATRYEQGLDTLVDHAVNGYNAMPAKGGNMSLTDANIRDSVIYILEQSSVEVAEAAATAEAGNDSAAADDAAAATETETETAAPDDTAVAVADDTETTAETDPEPATAQQPATATEDAAPVQVAAAGSGLIPAGIDLAQGKETYAIACVVCHDQGVAGAPKLGDQADWTARLDQDWDTLVDHAINGYNGMPAKGGRVDLPDDQIIDAVAYMVDLVQ